MDTQLPATRQLAEPAGNGSTACRWVSPTSSGIRSKQPTTQGRDPGQWHDAATRSESDDGAVTCLSADAVCFSHRITVTDRNPAAANSVPGSDQSTVELSVNHDLAVASDCTRSRVRQRPGSTNNLTNRTCTHECPGSTNRWSRRTHCTNSSHGSNDTVCSTHADPFGNRPCRTGVICAKWV
jgi:hypothetical protein